MVGIFGPLFFSSYFDTEARFQSPLCLYEGVAPHWRTRDLTRAGQDINDLGATPLFNSANDGMNVHACLDGRLPNDYVKIGKTAVDFVHAKKNDTNWFYQTYNTHVIYDSNQIY